MTFSPRKLRFLTGTAIVALALLCVMLAQHGSSTDARGRAHDAARQLDSATLDDRDSVRALSLAYVERARLGLGSPFRLVDEALHDPRLDDSAGDIVAWAIIDRIFDHGTYQVDASVLDAIGPRGAGPDHLALIERTIESGRDPRIGETTIRLAYGLASANGTLSAAALPAVIEVASLIRDRALAEGDLSRSVPRAKEDGVELTEEIARRRVSRDLEVERPLLGALSARDEDDAISAVPRVLAEIEAIEPDTITLPLAGRSLLSAQMAAIVARLGARRPPMAAATVILQTRGGVLQSDTTLSPSAKRFLSGATNEETLVAAFALATQFPGVRSGGAARVMVAAAVALRAVAQETAWFAGDPGPTAGEVAGRFALRQIEFDREVPTVWRSYYIRMIESALEDVTRVLPSYEPTGLTIRFVARSLPDSALAMHDPRTHTMFLPMATAAGAIAHELAHDLDWQSARRLFARGGGYASDRSQHENGGSLGNSIRGLAGAHSVNGFRVPSVPSSRPAEVFARSADWFIADGLAHLGRTNGYLSAIQDQLITGYAATPGDAASLSGASALLTGIAEMTAIPDSIGLGYLERWQSVDRLDPAAVMMRLREAPVLMRRPIRAPFDMPSTTMTRLAMPSLCRLDRLYGGSPRDRMIALTIEAKARGMLLRRARYTSPSNRPPWAHAILREAPWNRTASDEMLRRTTAAVLDGAAREGLVPAPPPPFAPSC